MTTDDRLSTRRRVWQLAWPMIVSNLSVPLLGLVDTAILGHLDTAVHLAAVAMGASILSFLFWGFGFLRMGTTSQVARANGANDCPAISRYLLQSLLLAIVIAAVLLLLRKPLVDLALVVMQPPDTIADEVARYCQIRLLSAPAALINFTLIGCFIGLQNTRLPLLILVSTNACNILMDALLILGLELGSSGAAWASMLADYIGLLLGGWGCGRLLKQRGVFLQWQTIFKDWRTLRATVAINSHLFVRTACLLATLAFFTLQGARQGDTILAANAILLQLLMLVSYGLDGFAHAAESLIGDATGRRDRTRSLAILAPTGYWSVVVAIGFGLAYILLKDQIIIMFTSLPSVRDELEQIYIWICLLPLLAVWGYWLDGVFIGTGRTDLMLVAMLIASGLVFLPLWWFTLGWGNQGLWLAMTAFNASRGLILGLFLPKALPA